MNFHHYWPNLMCFRVTINSLYFEVLSVNTPSPTVREMYRLFGYDSTAEFHKLRRLIWRSLPRKNGGPSDVFDLYRISSLSSRILNRL